MKPFRILFLSVVAITLLSAFLSSTARAADIIVNQADTANCISAASTTTSTYCNIQAAIDTAVTNSTSSLSVLVEPGSYTESLNLQGISVRGREAARTFLSGTVTAASGSSTFSRFFLTSSSVIDIQSGASLDVTSNIFDSLTTAIQIASTGSRIVNNVFYNNTTAISTSVDIDIINNIFLSNTTAIAPSVSLTKVTYNDFYGNGTNGFTFSTPDTTYHNINTNPSVVSQTGGDFHLTTGSPCIATGNFSQYPNSFDNTTSDIGAYGGGDADTIMILVSGLTGSVETTNSVSLTWTANTDYRLGGYHVYYGTSSGVYTGTDAAEGASPITVTGTSAVLSGLTATATPLSTGPTITTSQVLNGSLVLSWDAVSGATGYLVLWQVSDFTTDLITTATASYATTTDTSYPITGLTNGVKYKMLVYAYSQANYYIAVTAIDKYGPTFTPGIEHESSYSGELVAQLGDHRMEPGIESVGRFSRSACSLPKPAEHGPGLLHCNSGLWLLLRTTGAGFTSIPRPIPGHQQHRQGVRKLLL